MPLISSGPDIEVIEVAKRYGASRVTIYKVFKIH